jgi:hypothetical protein
MRPKMLRDRSLTRFLLTIFLCNSEKKVGISTFRALSNAASARLSTSTKGQLQAFSPTWQTGFQL